MKFHLFLQFVDNEVQLGGIEALGWNWNNGKLRTEDTLAHFLPSLTVFEKSERNASFLAYTFQIALLSFREFASI